MKSKLFIYVIGFVSGIGICLISGQIKKTEHNKAISEYLAYYEQHEFMQSNADQFDLNELKQLELIDLNNEHTRICLNSDKVVFINLWASWSQPSIDQLGGIENLKKQFGSEVDFYVITSESIDKLNKLKLTSKTNLPFYSYRDERLLPEYLKRGVVPFTLIIYKGSVWFEHIGAAPWDSDKIVNLINNIID